MPIIRTFTGPAGIEIEKADISVSARVLSEFSDFLTDEQKVPNTLGPDDISVLQRTREIGLMKALGMRKRDIGRLFRFEAAWIGFLGGVIGSLGAVALGAALNPWITKQLDLGEGNKLLIFSAPDIIGLVVILMIVSIFAGWLPSRKAAKLDPIEALRTE